MNPLEPTPTPFDLKWRMFGIPVRVHPSFWLFSLMMGYFNFRNNGTLLVIWVLCSFISILCHELGHVITGMIFGQPGRVLLFSFGGLAIGNYQYLRTSQRIIFHLAGPTVNLAIFGSLYYWRGELFAQAARVQYAEQLISFMLFMMIVNFLWGILNLAPVYPLDGGNVLRDICLAISRRQGLKISLGLSFLAAGAIAIYSVMVYQNPALPYLRTPDLFGPSGGGASALFNAILFGILAIQNYILLQAVDREQRRLESEEQDW